MRLPKFLRKENPAYRSIFATTGSTGPVWKSTDYASYIREGYLKCVTVYSCVSLIDKNASRIGWTLQQRDNELEEHPLLTLLRRPNEYESGARFIEKTLAFYQLAGNSYTLRVQGLPSNPPRYLYQMRPDRMTIEKSGDWKNPVGRYKYAVSGSSPEYFAPEDVLHITEFHPLDDWYGLSKIEVLARRVDISNEIANWNKKIFENDMRIPGIVKGKTLFDLDRLRDMWRERYQGSDNAGVPVFLEGEDIEFQPIASSPKDVDWINGNKTVMRDICSTIGVPSMLLGDTEATTYANYQEARKALYQETILPLMDLLRDEYNAWLVPLYGDGLYLDYDRDGIEALQEDREKKYTYLQKASWLTVNEKRVACGYDERPDGDELDKPAPPPAFGAPEEEPEQEPEPDQPKKSERKSFWANPERKAKLWATFEERVKTREKSFQTIARDYLKRQQGNIVAALEKVGSLGVNTTQIFDLDAEVKRYEKDFYPWYRDHFIRAGNAGMRASKGELFNDAEFKDDAPTSWVFRMTPKQEKELHRLVYESGTKVNTTTLDRISTQLYRAQTENLTVDEFARAIADDVAEFDPWRARLWSRTESAKVDNFGQVEGMRATEFVDAKIWICSFVPTSRDAHESADGQTVGIDDGFNIGGESLDYPGDPRGSAGQVCNCLCSVAPVVSEN